MSFNAQPNYLAAVPQQVDYGQVMGNVEAIKGARARNALADQSMAMNEQAMAMNDQTMASNEMAIAFKQAVAMGDMETAMQMDPQATIELMQKREDLEVAQFDSQTRAAQSIYSVIAPFQDMTDQQVLQMAPIAIQQLQAQGLGEGLNFVPGQTTADQVRSVIGNTMQQIQPYLEPSQWTGGQAAIDLQTGEPTYMQTDQYGRSRPVEGYAPPPTKGFSVTTADGTVVEYGAGAGGGNMEKTTRKNLEETINASANSLGTLGRMIDGFESDYLTLGGKAKAFTLWGKASLSPELLTPQERNWYSKMNTWRVDAFDFMNEEIKRLTGAAMSEPEAVRLRKGMPDPENDDPITFMDKARAKMRKLTLVRARAHYYLENGMQPPADKNKPWAVGIDEMEQIIEDRAEKLYEIFSAGGDDEERARVRADQQTAAEFGL